MDIHLQHQVLSDLGWVHFSSCIGDDLHHTGRWRSSIGDGSSGRQHRHVETNRHILLAGRVHTLDVICLSLVRDQFRMFLNNQDEACLSLQKAITWLEN